MNEDVSETQGGQTIAPVLEGLASFKV